MTKTADILRPVIDRDYEKLRDTFRVDPYYAIQILIRRLDVITLFFQSSKHLTEEGVNESREYFNFGWSPLIKLFFKDHDFGKLHHFIATSQKDYDWADSVILHSGKLAFCKQLLDYEKAKVLEFSNPKANEFEIKYKSDQTGIEYFDRLSANFFAEHVLGRMINEKKSKLPFTEEEIKLKLRAIIKNPYDKFISYETTPEIDEYYNQRGHLHIMGIQGYDDFNTTDTFGSIEYWKYVDLIEIIMGVAIMHTEACLELIKMNPSVDMHNILTYMYFKDSTIKIYAGFLGVPYEEIEQIISCFTVSKDNYESYLENISPAPPMYFQVSDNQIIRSVAGCLGNPLRILNTELKRRFPRDYDLAVNRREERFRKELFGLLPQDRIIKIPNEVNLSFNGAKTDIDAIVYDTATKSLGLFQLKWQDPFGHSMRERFSRITNLFPKAQEWIDKIGFWINSVDQKTILNSLQVNKYAPQAKEISEIYVFVLARNHMHFTGVKTDERVAWGSWYQLIESLVRVKAEFDDPIREMFVKLQTFAPEHRMTKEEMPTRQNFEAKIGDYRIYYAEQN